MTPQERFDLFVKLVAEGHTAKQVARVMGGHPARVAQAGSLLGVRLTGGHRLRDNTIMGLIKQGVSYEAIAHQMGLKQKTISNVALRNGVRKRLLRKDAHK